jgi:hypothetical protein
LIQHEPRDTAYAASYVALRHGMKTPQKG